MSAAAAPDAPAFPWREAMAFGFGALRLSSEDFWRLSPRELVAAMRFHFGEAPTPLRRAELAALIARFPDGTEKKNGR